MHNFCIVPGQSFERTKRVSQEVFDTKYLFVGLKTRSEGLVLWERIFASVYPGCDGSGPLEIVDVGSWECTCQGKDKNVDEYLYH